jgi:hypothetical protein
MATRPRIVRAVVPRDPRARDPVPAGDDKSGEDQRGDDQRGDNRASPAEEPVDPDFDEATYLRAFPDVADAVRRGMLVSGLAHYLQAGRAEMRLEKPEYRALRDAYGGPAPPQVAVDTLTISPSGSTLMTGWSDDRFDRLAEVNLATRPDTKHNWAAFPRLVRADVERTLDASSGHRFGFMLVAAPVGGLAAPIIDARAANAPVFSFASGVEARLRRDPVVASDADLRDLALAALPTATPGEFDPDVIYGILDQHVGVQIAAINRLIIEQARARRMIERRGLARGRYRGSVITSLRGGAHQIVPRLTLACTGPGSDDYEFIVVVTSPDQFEPALRAARIVEATLGLALTIVLQPGGDSAGCGEDAAADIARSDRLILMDQAVLPRDADWLARHTALLDAAPPRQTMLFGGMLHHPDGSLTNGGYYFEQETSFVTRQFNIPHRVATPALKAVTHPVMRDLPPVHEVTGVPAAFMSVDRAWFESLGGFARQYSRAAYEDIDFCLRSLGRGVPAWVHPLPLRHFEQKRPVRAEPSKGGAIFNNWLFHRQWDAIIVPGLLGPRPA